MAQQSPAAKNCSHAKSDGWSSFLGPLKSHVWHYKLVHRETFMASRARSLAWIFFITFSSSTISSLLVVSLDLQIYGRHFNPTQHFKRKSKQISISFPHHTWYFTYLGYGIVWPFIEIVENILDKAGSVEETIMYNFQNTAKFEFSRPKLNPSFILIFIRKKNEFLTAKRWFSWLKTWEEQFLRR